MDNKELLVLCALRNILFEEEYNDKFIDSITLTDRAKKNLLSDCESMFSFSPNSDIALSLKSLVVEIPVVEEIQFNNIQLNYLYLRAIMYSLGRRTYITGVSKEWTEEYLSLLNKETKQEVVRLIENRHNLGDQCDIDNWQTVKKLLKD